METQANAVCTFKDGILYVAVSGEIDHHSVRQLREEIDGSLYLYQPRVVMLDLSGMRFMDSSGLGFIVGRLENAKTLGGTLEITGASERVKKIFEMAGLLRTEGLIVR